MLIIVFLRSRSCACRDAGVEEPCVTDSSIRHVVEKLCVREKNNATNCAIATTIGNVKKKGFFLGDYIRVGN